MKECPRGFAQICKHVWERTGDRRGDAEAEQQGDNAEKHSEENVGRGPHGFREHTEALPMSYFEDKSSRRSAAKLLSKGEARRIAANIAKLPDLLR